jgi:hypothetical protein
MEQEFHFHPALQSRDVELSKDRRAAWAIGAAGRAYNFAVGHNAIAADPSTGDRAFQVRVDSVDGKHWPKQCIEVGLTTCNLSKLSQLDLIKVVKRCQLPQCWSFGGRGKFYIATGWNRCDEVEMPDWKQLQDGDVIRVSVSDKGLLSAFVNGTSRGILQTNMSSQMDIWHIIEFHAPRIRATFAPAEQLPSLSRQVDLQHHGTVDVDESSPPPPALEQEQALCRKVKLGDVAALQGRLQTTPRPSHQELADYLCVAAGFGHTHCVQLLLDAAACPNTPSVVEECGQRGETRRNALHEACLWGCGARDQVVIMLLQHGANMDLTAKLRGRQMTADRIAAQKGFRELEKLIHAHSQHLRACSRSRTPPNRRTNEATIAPNGGNAKNMAADVMSECCACGTLPRRIGAKFCDECGSSLIIAPTTVTIQGFRRSADTALLRGEDEWDMLRAEIAAEVAQGLDVKEEELSDIEADEPHTLPGDVVVIDNLIDNVMALQENISPTFRRCGRPLESLVQELQTGKANPMTSDFLILNAAVANIRIKKRHWETKYFTLDHRRLWCLHRAGVTRVRLRLQLGIMGRSFDEFVNKAKFRGRRVTDLVVTPARR